MIKLVPLLIGLLSGAHPGEFPRARDAMARSIEHRRRWRLNKAAGNQQNLLEKSKGTRLAAQRRGGRANELLGPKPWAAVVGRSVSRRGLLPDRRCPLSTKMSSSSSC